MDCHCIEGIRDENGLVESKPSCSHGLRKKIAIPKSPIYWAKQFTPTDLMGDSSAGRCLDGSQTSLDLFVEGFTWMINI